MQVPVDDHQRKLMDKSLGVQKFANVSQRWIESVGADRFLISLLEENGASFNKTSLVHLVSNKAG